MTNYKVFSHYGRRYYYNVENNKALIYPSVTTILSAEMPNDWFRDKLISELTLDGYRKMLSEKAKYGTILHRILEIYVNQDYTINDATIMDIINEEVSTDTELYIIDNIHKIKIDILRYSRFFKDYNVKIIATEKTFVDSIFNYAGTVDYIVEMDYTEKGYFGDYYKSGANKGEPKESKETRRIIAIIDLKSGSADLEQYNYQLSAYFYLAQFNNYAVEKAFILKKPRTGYNYSLKEIETFNNLRIFELMTNMYYLKGKNEIYIDFYNELQELTIDTTIENYYEKILLSDFIMQMES